MLENGGIAPPFLTSALDGDELSALCSGCFTPGETALGIHCTGGWVGPRADLDGRRREGSLSPAENRTAIPGHRDRGLLAD
jgi:hypothetical protein